MAFQKAFSQRDFDFLGHKVSAGVPDQPMNARKTYEGTGNRALYLKRDFPDGEFWIGIEGGIENIYQDMHASARMVILNKEKQGEARTATFILPQKKI